MSRSRFGRVLLLGALALVLAYGVSEVWLRLAVTPPPDPAHHPFLWPPLTRLRFDIRQPVPGLPPRSTVFTTNSLGLRGDELDLAGELLKPPGERMARVLVLGGSVTECLLLDDENAWPLLLQQRLTAGLGRPVWVGNAGRSGQMTLDYVVHALVLVPLLQPDLVVVLAGGNDLQAAAEDHYLPITLDNRELVARTAIQIYQLGCPACLDALEPSYTWYFLERRFKTEAQDYAPFYLRMKQRRLASPKVEQLEEPELLGEIYRNNLATLIAALDKSGSKLLLVTHPYLWKEQQPAEEEQALWAGYSCMNCKNPKYYSRHALIQGLSGFNRLLLETCQGEHRHLCFDLEPKIEKTLENFYDDAHLKEQGARRVADELSRYLLAQQLLKKR